MSGLLRGCCEHGNVHLGLQNEGNSLRSWINIRFLRRTPLHANSQLLTSATSSLSTHNPIYYRIMNSKHSVSSPNTTQFLLYTVCRYNERLLHCTSCCVLSVPSEAVTLWQYTVLLCKWTGEIWGSYEEYRLVTYDVTAVWYYAAGSCLCTIITEYLSAITLHSL